MPPNARHTTRRQPRRAQDMSTCREPGDSTLRRVLEYGLECVARKVERFPRALASCVGPLWAAGGASAMICCQRGPVVASVLKLPFPTYTNKPLR